MADTREQSHETLKLWDEGRRARDANEKSIADIMLTNIEQRIELGKSACNDLHKYVKDVASYQKDFVKDYGKLGAALDEKLNYGSLEHAVALLKVHNQNACTIYEEHNKILNDTIGPQISSLASEYSKQGSNIIDAAKKLSKNLDQARETSSKNFNLYVSAYEEFAKVDKNHGVPQHDPWLLERNYQDSLITVKVEREKFTSEMGQLFEKFLALEEKRIEATKTILQLHASKQKLILGKLVETTTDFSTAAESVNTVADRQLLIKQHFNRQDIISMLFQTQQRMLSAPTKDQTPQSLSLLQQQQTQLRAQLPPQPVAPTQPPPPGQTAGQPVFVPPPPKVEYDAPPKLSMEVSKTGFLNKQSGLFKSWKNTWLLLTATGFVYSFASQEDRNPEFLFSLASVTVTHLKDFEEPRVFEVVVNPGAFFSSQRHVFKAETDDELAVWLKAFNSFSPTPKQ